MVINIKILLLICALLISSKSKSEELWDSVNYDMSFSELSSLYSLKEASDHFIPHYRDYFGDSVLFQGVSFKPRFILISDKVKEVELINQNPISDVPRKYKEFISYYENNYGAYDNHIEYSEKHEIYEWKIKKVTIHLTRKGNRKKQPIILIRFTHEQPSKP